MLAGAYSMYGDRNANFIVVKPQRGNLICPGVHEE
jgi:hypothetical protein